MARVKLLLKLAHNIAVKNKTHKHYNFGAIGIRTDGTLVCSTNLPVANYTPAAHAEARLLRKLNTNSEVFVVRVNHTARVLARPCSVCYAALKARGIKRCYYSIDDDSYGVIDFK